jgi:hypothetical protein
MLLLTLLSPTRALAWSQNPTTPEGWAWKQIKAGNLADFNDHCGTTLDPHNARGWDDPCRHIPAQFLIDLLTMPKWQNQVTRRGVRLRGAHVVEDIDLSNAEIVSELRLDASLVAGALDLDDAHLKRPLSFRESVLRGELFADRMNTESLILLADHATFAGDVSMVGAKVGGDLDMNTASFSKKLRADRLDVHGDLFVRHASFAGDVSLIDATVGGELSMSAASFSQELSADGLDVHHSLVIHDHTSFAGDVRLPGAKIGGDIEIAARFSDALIADGLDVHGNLFMRDHSSFAGHVRLLGAKVGGDLDMVTASFSKTLSADGLDVHGSLFLNDASFADDVRLVSAKVGGNPEMDTASFSKRLDANGLDVHLDLYMRDHANFAGDVLLRGAKVGGNLQTDTASFSDALIADGLDVHGNLYMRDHATFAGDVLLRGAKVGGDLDISSTSFSKTLTAYGLDVHGYLFMRDASFADDVILRGAKAGSDLDISSASFSKTLTADGLDVHGHLFMRGHASFADDVSLVGATVARLDLGLATAARIDLSEAAVSELQLRGLNWRCRETRTERENSGTSQATVREATNKWPLGDPSWRKARCEGTEQSLPTLILRNAHFEALQDDPDSWPPAMDLEGLRYDRLGGLQSAGSADLRRRTPEQWIDWLARDRTFSSQPYNQLATVFTAAGRRDTADAILFAGRERERDETWSRSDIGFWQWLQNNFQSWIWLTFLSGVAGYGIGLYTFRVVRWVVGLTILGAAALWFSPYARQRSVAWRLGASLHRLLPIVELSKEFNDFFDNTNEPDKPRKLDGWLIAFFAGIALAGWVLGFFLLAAMGGLTQK